MLVRLLLANCYTIYIGIGLFRLAIMNDRRKSILNRWRILFHFYSSLDRIHTAVAQMCMEVKEHCSRPENELIQELADKPEIGEATRERVSGPASIRWQRADKNHPTLHGIFAILSRASGCGHCSCCMRLATSSADEW